ncbi:hypothetical protein MO867_09715 [Microbulbifer sp. OS29]|uniref:Uncharacterized protein n=1 Tax=Microbulbifer okhotskensis TaxID=2926617 RepID=A0A9X2EN26_9GAMM|nr:hypothetical protein [Microbulbifer okhotskensis]MCO1334615.1 hypothetical protein [Microbulbifer okhotskensis]
MRVLFFVLFFLAPLFSKAADIKVQQEPLKTLSTCLIMHSWRAWGIWQYEVYALARNRVLVGAKDNHYLVTSTEPGYSHIVNGDVVARYPEAVALQELGNGCQENCPVNHIKRTSWFKRRCKAYSP